MTREEAIKFAHHAYDMTDIPDVKEFYAIAENALREQEEHRWIPVTERLPEESGDYLVILDWGTMCVLEFSKVHQAFNASDSIPNDAEIFCTHWMPLPQPPKGE